MSSSNSQLRGTGPSERDRLLPTSSTRDGFGHASRRKSSGHVEGDASDSRNIGTILLFSTVAFLVIWVTTFQGFYTPWNPREWHQEPAALPEDPLERAHALLSRHPLIDGHIDTPIQARLHYSNAVQDIDLNGPPMRNVNIPKLRAGGVGGFFWSAYVPCAADAGQHEGPDYVNATWRVRDTLEQIDITQLLVDKYSDTFELTTSATGVREAFANKRIASLIGIEGAHQLGNSIAVARQYYQLGVRYITLTHTCNNAFAGSAGFQGKPIEARGLSDFGLRLVHEMNRLGMIVDISHTSEQTSADVLKHSRSPVIFSHSNAKAVWDVPRNVPDYLLKEVKRTSSVVMATFAPQFVSQSEQGVGERATLKRVADHIEHIASVAGKESVGLGSDFDGILSTPEGLEDVSKYPYLIAELISRGWTDSDIIGLIGGNFLRVFARVEEVATDSKHLMPETGLYGKRPDLPWKPEW